MNVNDSHPLAVLRAVVARNVAEHGAIVAMEAPDTRRAGDLVAELFAHKTLLSWHGERWSDMPRDPADMPAPGDTVSAGTFGMRDCTGDRAHGYGVADSEATHLQVPVTLWGDYVGSTIERANALALTEAYPDVFVTVTYDYSTECLALALDQEIPVELYDGLVSLANDYPVWDDESLSTVESELWDEAWQADVKADLTSELDDLSETMFDGLSALVGALTDDVLRDTFDAACSDENAMPRCEDAVSATLDRHDWSRIVKRVAVRILTEAYGDDTTGQLGLS